MPSRHTPLRIAFQRPWPGTVRGRILWFFAGIIGIKGTGYLLGSESATVDRSMRLFTMWLPLEVWGAVVVAVCGFAMFCAYCHHGRDKWGYDAMTGLCAGWAAIYAVSPFFLGGPFYALQGTLSYFAIAGALIFLRRLRDIRDEALRGHL